MSKFLGNAMAIVKELQDELELVKDLLRRAIPCAFHDKECDLSIDPSKLCNCWVIEAYDVLYPNEPVQESQNAVCECGDTFNDHTVKFGKDFACSRVNCTCYAFIKTKS